MSSHSLPSYSEYRDSLVIFADLLGFSHQIDQIRDEESFQEAVQLLGVLHEQSRLWQEFDGALDGFRATTISDSIIITMPWKSEVAATALIAAMHGLQYQLLLHKGKLLRGYMARGRIFTGQGLLFGDGFTRAYRREEALKGPPRIVVDPELVEFAKSRGADRPPPGMRSAFEYLRQDESDNLWYIDYLKPVGIQERCSPKRLRMERETILVAIRDGMEIWKSDNRVLRKYEWLRDYELTSRPDLIGG